LTKERMKTIKVIDELIAYFFSHQVDSLQVDVHYGQKQVKIMLQGTCVKKPDDLDQLDEVLNTPRRDELEEYYWSLLGESRSYQELNLLGALVDCADVIYENQKLTVTVFRKK